MMSDTDQEYKSGEWLKSGDFRKPHSIEGAIPIDDSVKLIDNLSLNSGHVSVMFDYGIRKNSMYDDIGKVLPIALTNRYLKLGNDLPEISNEASEYLLFKKMITEDGIITDRGEKLLSRISEINPYERGQYKEDSKSDMDDIIFEYRNGGIKNGR